MTENKAALAVIFAVVVESAGVFVWAGSAAARLKEVEVRLSAQSAMAERMARVEVQLELQSAQLDRIERKLAGE